LIEFLEEAKRCSGCNRIRMDLLPEYDVYPICTLAHYVLPENYYVPLVSYFCPFFCEDILI